MDGWIFSIIVDVVVVVVIGDLYFQVLGIKYKKLKIKINNILVDMKIDLIGILFITVAIRIRGKD